MSAPREYFHNGRCVEWGENLSAETQHAMKQGEIFALYTPDGSLHSYVGFDQDDEPASMTPVYASLSDD